MSKAWAIKRRVLYITTFGLIVFIIATPFIKKALTHTPTCHDGIQNQGETAPDLGGPCHYLNPADLRRLNVQWARSFTVVPGVYSAVAYVENPNRNAGIQRADYIIRTYDDRGVIVAEREGFTFIPPGKVVPIFEGNLPVGGRVPVRTTLEFTNRLIWERMDPTLAEQITVRDQALRMVRAAPRLTAKVHNASVYALQNLVVVAVLFDEAGNAIGASRTIVDVLEPDGDAPVTFTWPKSFATFISRADVVPLLPPYTAIRKR